jgi:hypothetical protein
MQIVHEIMDGLESVLTCVDTESRYRCGQLRASGVWNPRLPVTQWIEYCHPLGLSGLE